MAKKTTQYSRFVTDEYLREKILIIGRELVAEGRKCSWNELHPRGVRGGRDRISAAVRELIERGDLPPEAEPTKRGKYTMQTRGPALAPRAPRPEKPPSPPLSLVDQAVKDYKRTRRSNRRGQRDE
jgi:hypothetical protein